MKNLNTKIRFFCSIGLLISFVMVVFAYGAVFQFEGSVWPGFAVRSNTAVALRVFAAPAVQKDLENLRLGMRVTHVEDLAVSSGQDVYRAVGALRPGTPVNYTLENMMTGATSILTVPAQEFSQAVAYRVWLPLLGVGLIFMGTLCLPVFVRTDSATSRALFLVGTGVANQYCFGLPLLFLSHRHEWLPQLFGFSAMAGVWTLALVFPVSRMPMRRFPKLTVLFIWLIATLFVFAALAWMHPPSAQLFFMEYIRSRVLLAGFVILSCNVLYTALRHESFAVRGHAKVFMRGMLLGGLVMGGVVLLNRFGGARFSYLEPLVWANPLLIFSSTISIGMLRYGLFGFGREARRSLGRLSLFFVALSTGYAGFGLLEIFFDTAQAWGMMFAASLALSVVFALWPRAYRSLEGLLEAVLMPERQRTRVTLETVAMEMAGIRDTRRIGKYMEKVLGDALGASWARCIVGSPGEPLMEISPRENSHPVLPQSKLYELIQGGGSLVTQPGAAPGGSLSVAVVEARQKDISLMASMPPQGSFVGALLCGPSSRGTPYTASDFALLKLLATSVAAALENARSWHEVHELRARLEQENTFLRSEVRSDRNTSESIGSSALLRDALAQLKAVAPTAASVLVIGETGVGKELAVRLVHQYSPRADKALVKVACAALPESLLESELFGYERGAFTGAAQRRIGRFEVAHQGTLFLDDVDTLSLPVQAKLLRVIQEGEIQRLGSNAILTVDVRLVAATNRDLLAEVRAGRFREDLYYRLNVVPIQLPPLRARMGDIPALVAHFANTLGPALGREIEELSSACLETLQGYAWPGNIRELRNVVERALVMGRGPVLQLPAGAIGPVSSVIPLVVRSERPPAEQGASPEGLGGASLKELLLDRKRELILAALVAHQGNQAAAAKSLGVHRSNLNRMIKDLELPII